MNKFTAETRRCLRTLFLLAFVVVPSGVRAEEGDPFGGMNRGIFWFNDKVDVYFLEPIAKGWDFIAPKPVQTAIANFFDNLRFPINTVNNFLQCKPLDAASDVARFTVNTTVGVLGFFDFASGWGLKRHEEDFGQTLGVWGVPPGPYLVLPLMGASNIRDTVAIPVDSATAVYPFFVGIVYTLPARGVFVVNARSRLLDEVRELKSASVDYYVAVRDGFVRLRETQVRDTEEISEEEEDDLYYPDDTQE